MRIICKSDVPLWVRTLFAFANLLDGILDVILIPFGYHSTVGFEAVWWYSDYRGKQARKRYEGSG